jgi:hypothetical protein
MKGYQFKSAWAFRRGCRNSPLELLNLKETRLPNSNNQIWTDWWFESAGEGQQFSQTLTENMVLFDSQRKNILRTFTDSITLTDLVSTSNALAKILAENLHISDYVLTSLSGGQYYGILKRWSGTNWMNESLKTYLSGWMTKPLKRWNGTNWIEVNIGG